MKFKISEIIEELESFAPTKYQEDYDNSGLLVGDSNKSVERVLISLDCIESVVDEAIATKCGLIISHHPILFSGLKQITGKNYIERVILKAIKNNIAIYAMHTNLDNVKKGVNAKIAEKIGLENIKILAPMQNTLYKLYTYIPESHFDKVRSNLFLAGAGQIGNYSDCSFSALGNGTFKANDTANPFIGKKNELHLEPEIKLEVIFTIEKKSKILEALRNSHPYEEIAYEIISLENENQDLGAGLIGDLPKPMEESSFLKLLKKKMLVPSIRHTELLGKKISKVALCGGSGSFLLQNAIQQKADIFISADFKYHQFFDADKKIIIVDIGHFESEQFTGEIFYEILSKKFPNFAFHFTSVNTNPIKYY